MTAAEPASSTGQPAGTLSKSSTPAILPPRTWTAARRVPAGVTTRWLRTIRSGRNGKPRSQSDEIQLDLDEPVLARPGVQRRAGDLVDQGHRTSQPREIDALQVVLARLASLKPKVIKSRSSEVSQLALVFLPALRAQRPTK